MLYGSDAIAGVVQIVTRQWRAARPAASATGEGGTYGSLRWDGSAPVAAADALGWSASVVPLDDRRDLRLQQRTTATPWLSGRARGRPDASTTVALSGRFADGAFHFPTDFTGAPTDHNQSTAERTTTLALDLTRRLGRAVDGQLLVGRHAANDEFVNPPDSASDPSGFSDSRTDIRRWTVETRALLRLPAGVRGLAGVSLDDERQESFARAAADQPLATSDSTRERTNWGFYVQAVAAPHPALQLTVGGRLDQNERFGSFGTYRMSALAFVTGLTRLRASVGTGFKEPGFFDNYATGFATGNPDLRPERSFSVEGGVTQEVPSLRASVSRHRLRATLPRPDPVHLRASRSRRPQLLQRRRRECVRRRGRRDAASRVGPRAERRVHPAPHRGHRRRLRLGRGRDLRERPTAPAPSQ